MANMPNGHSRGAGIFAKVLCLVGRENDVPLMFSLPRMLEIADLWQFRNVDASEKTWLQISLSSTPIQSLTRVPSLMVLLLPKEFHTWLFQAWLLSGEARMSSRRAYSIPKSHWKPIHSSQRGSLEEALHSEWLWLWQKWSPPTFSLSFIDSEVGCLSTIICVEILLLFFTDRFAKAWGQKN